MSPKGIKDSKRFEIHEIYSIIILVNVTVMAFSSIMVMATKRELMFPQRTAPKYVFDVVQNAIILLFGALYLRKQESL